MKTFDERLTEENKEIIMKMRDLMIKLDAICENEDLSVKINALDMLAQFYKKDCVASL